MSASPPGSPRLVDSFTAPKEILQEFADLAEEEDFDPFQQTASKRQIAARQSDYHNRRFNRVALDSVDAFKAGEAEDDVEGGYKDAMRLQRLEREEQRVKRAIEQKERREREEEKEKMDLDRTPDAAEFEEAAKELEERAATRKKRRWDQSDASEDKENLDIKPKEDTGEWSKEALEAAAPKKRRSRWDATPSEAAEAAPKRSRWDQTPAPEPIQPMAQI